MPVTGFCDDRKSTLKLRTGDNCLFLEKGRYESIPGNRRLFPFRKCEVEDLEHFAFKFNKTKVCRDKFPGDEFKDKNKMTVDDYAKDGGPGEV